MMNEVRLRALDTVRRIVFDRLTGREVRVFLFGSCARGTPRHWSDIDVAIDPTEPIPAGVMADIVEDLDESTVPYFVDVVDLTQARPEFREAVMREGVEWTR